MAAAEDFAGKMCPICPKREKSRKRLAIHEYKYHKENKYRYICPICQDVFTRPGNVRQHLARAHRVPREHQGVISRLEVNLPILSEEDPPAATIMFTAYN